MADERTSRAEETRAKAARPTSWIPPEMLPYPNPEPGFEFRYIRISTLGEADPSNISMKFREGWIPCKAVDYPELMVHSVTSGKYAGCIEFGGLLLCKIPEEFMQQRGKYYEDLTKRQMDTVDQTFFKENDARAPLFKERKTEVKFGSGN